MSSENLPAPRLSASAVELARAVLAEISEPEFADGQLSFTYLNRKIEGSVTEAGDLLAECLYATIHAKYVSVFDDESDDLATTEHRESGSRLANELGELFRDRVFPISLPVHDVSESGRIVLRHRGLRVHCPPDRITAGAEPGTREVLVEHYSAAVSPGFFYIFGRGAPEGRHLYQERTYISVAESSDIATLAPVLVAELDNRALEYSVKFLIEENTLARTDTVAIYHDSPERAGEAVVAAVARSGISTGVVSDYCIEIGPGIGRSQEPIGRFGQGRSFGQHRSRMLAQAVVHSITSATDLASACARSASEYLIDPECVALNQG